MHTQYSTSPTHMCMHACTHNTPPLHTPHTQCMHVCTHYNTPHSAYTHCTYHIHAHVYTCHTPHMHTPSQPSTHAPPSTHPLYMHPPPHTCTHRFYSILVRLPDNCTPASWTCFQTSNLCPNPCPRLCFQGLQAKAVTLQRTRYCLGLKSRGDRRPKRKERWG